MNIKKYLSVLLSACMILTLFSACGSGNSDSEKTADTGNEQQSSKKTEELTEITYWGWDNNYYEPMGEAFSDANPGYELVVTPVAHADYISKIRQSVASGSELPDILLGESNLRGSLFEIDIWEDLSEDPYNVLIDDFFDLIKNRCLNSKGELVGIEQTVCPAGMAYKRDVAKKYLGTDDREELESMFTNIDSYIEIAKDVQEKSNGEVFLFHSPGLVMEWLYLSDTTPVTNEEGDLDFTGKMTKILSDLCALRDAGAIDKYEMGTPQANAAYAGDKHIFFPCANWAVDYHIKANDAEGEGNWGLMMPTSDGGYHQGGTAMGISKSSKNKEAAWKFINWCTMTQDGVDASKQLVNYYVPTKKFYDDSSYVSKVDPFFDGQDIGSFLYNEIVPNIEVAEVSPYDATMYDVSQLLAQALIAMPDMTAEEALAKGIEECKNSLSDVTVK